MKHQTQAQIKATNLQIAEVVVKGMIKRGNIKEAIEISEKNHISSERFGELTKLATN